MLSGFFGARKGGAWTFQESAAAFTNTLLLMGAAGYSVDELWKNYEPWIIETFGLDPANPDHQAIITTFRGGFMELVTLKAFDTTLDVSDRLGVASGINLIYENTIKPMLGTFFNGDDKDLSKALLGASAGVKTRLFDAVHKVSTIFSTAIDTGTFNSAVVTEVARALVQLPSSTNNLYTAYLWKVGNKIPVKGTGESLGMEPGGSIILAKAMGIEPLAMEKFYIIDRKSKEYDQLKMEISKSVAKIVRDLYRNGAYKSDVAVDFAHKEIQYLASELEGRDREDVFAAAIANLDKEDKKEALIVKLINAMAESEDNTEAFNRHLHEIQILDNLDAGKDNAQ
jgi:hypothetical protein